MKDPKTQYQVNDSVVYIAEGIITKISGYVWDKPYSDDDRPKLVGYQLACGVACEVSEMRRATRAELTRLDPAEVTE